MRLLLLHNPRAGGGRARRLLPGICAALRAEGFELDVVAGRRAGDGSVAVGRAAAGQYDGAVAMGGDGTLFELVNGLWHHPPDRRPPVGVIPVGTGNAFARDLGLEPGDWRAAVSVLAAGRTRRFDVGRVTTSDDSFCFVNVAGAGFVVEAGKTALRMKAFGRSAYTLATLWRLLRLRSYAFRLEIDGQTIAQPLIFVDVSNTRYTGTRFLIAPGAAPDDGLLDVTLLDALTRWRLLWLFPSVYSGRHLRYPEVSVYRGRSIRLLAPAGAPLIVDGEFRGVLPAEIRCVPGALTVFCR